ncbi:hypothetical protein Y032_0003g1398 [Ancylostoma ceylanicum]|uniref:Uncharacterized protein n=1 Tax=Ancylostoma ceylanicum TaxID=53326 RepID=A0A016VYM1_9BILA|nr:hypothetical protein Y032_0003g1398 [Ancylostoma ceylanicum]
MGFQSQQSASRTVVVRRIYPPAPHRHATASHASCLAIRYTGPRFQPGLSWPDKSRRTRLLSAAAEARLSFQSRLPAYIHLGCHVAMEKKKQAAGIPAEVLRHAHSQQVFLLHPHLQQVFLLQPG